MLNVSRRAVQSARDVIEEGAPELISAVEHGAASVSAAAEIAELPKDEQAEIVARGENEIIKTANRIRREEKERRKSERELAKRSVPADLPKHTDRCRVFCSAIEDVEINDESIDCILTDPPYRFESLGCFSTLAKKAARWLKPGGTLAVMSGQAWLPFVMENLSHDDIEYRWTLAYLTPGGQAVQVFARNVITFWKPILLYTKRGASCPEWIGDVARSEANHNDKRFRASPSYSPKA